MKTDAIYVEQKIQGPQVAILSSIISQYRSLVPQEPHRDYTPHAFIALADKVVILYRSWREENEIDNYNRCAELDHFRYGPNSRRDSVDRSSARDSNFILCSDRDLARNGW